MDCDGLRMLHIFMLDHMRKMNMHEAAAIFAREAGIGNAPYGFNPPDGFLGDWWCIFWDMYMSRMYDRSDVGEATGESSAQAEARARAQAQANYGMETHQPLVYAMGQASNPQFPFHSNIANIMGQPILAARRNDAQHGVLPCYIDRRGWAFPEHSSNPRHNRHNIAQSSRQLFRRARRHGNQIGRVTTSNQTSHRATRVMNPAISGPRNADSLDLNAMFEHLNIRMAKICGVLASSIRERCRLLV